MRKIRLSLNKRSYDIIIGGGIINSLGSIIKKMRLGADAYIITNPKLKKKFGPAVKLSLDKAGISCRFKTVPDTEKSKSLTYLAAVIRDIAEYDKKKKIFVIALGGGVIGDLSGFVASIYKRGIPYIQVPTTLLAQVDSSIGGKTAIDLKEGKNLVGAFYQPRMVLSDVRFLKTLPRRQLYSGLAEVIKYAIISDPGLFSYLEKHLPEILSAKDATLEHIINASSRIKAEIVAKDEREERGIRTILNFGHTVGHAIEAASGYRGYTHGEAIALGMLVASRISCERGLISPATLEKIRALIQKAGLPTVIRKTPLKAIIKAHYRDKKFIGSRNRFVLIAGIGKTKIVENIPLGMITQAIKRYLG